MEIHSRSRHDSVEDKTTIYSPWIIFFKQLCALFENDPEVSLEFDDDEYCIKLKVDNPAKADALSRLLPERKEFGNVVVNIDIIPCNEFTWAAKYLEVAFDGNEAFSHLTIVEDLPDVYISNPIAYCVFKKEVVQYGADDLGSESGMRSTLYEDLAREVFKDGLSGIYFCTDTK